MRTYGASGKHLSDQSRSMLALFQESAIRLKDSQEGVLVPFSYFYDPLHKFIDHQHSQVITDAEDNSRLDEFWLAYHYAMPRVKRGKHTWRADVPDNDCQMDVRHQRRSRNAPTAGSCLCSLYHSSHCGMADYQNRRD